MNLLYPMARCIGLSAAVGVAVMFVMVVPMVLFGYGEMGVKAVSALSGIGASTVTFVFTYPKGRSDLI